MVHVPVPVREARLVLPNDDVIVQGVRDTFQDFRQRSVGLLDPVAGGVPEPDLDPFRSSMRQPFPSGPGQGRLAKTAR